MKKVLGNQRLVRITNQKLIIDAIRENGLISRAELSKLLKLSLPSVSSNIDRLIKQGLLVEVGEGDSSGGRKPIMLEFNNNYGNIIGIDMAGMEVKVAVSNLKPEILAKMTFAISENSNGEEILQILIEKVSEIISKYKLHKIMAIVIAIPGIINSKDGYVEYSYRFRELARVDIKKAFEEQFKTTILLRNDINTAVLGELCYGCGKGYLNLVYVGVDVGIGAGIVLNGKLYEGAHYCAGEIGYLALSQDVFETKHRKRRYLGPIASIKSIVENVKSSIKNGAESSILSFVNGDAEKISFIHVVKALQEGDKLCYEHVINSARILGIAVSNIANILDVDLIIIGNEAENFGPDYINTVRSVVNKMTVTSPQIAYSLLKNEAVIYGTFAIALEYILNNIIK